MRRTVTTDRYNKAKVAVVGGGIAGASVAFYLGAVGLNVTLFEKGTSLVNGPPMCHLHAGGNLYREISDTQCITLLRQSIDLLRFYPFAIDYRPTVIAVPTEDSGEPQDLLPRLHTLQSEYASLIASDPGNKVLGEIDEYFKLYDRKQVETLTKLKENEIEQLSETLCKERGYPVAMANRLIANSNASHG